MTDNLELNMNAYLPLRDVVFNTLREAILKGELKPGERLMELQLASKLGVSRTPIREAIRMLEQEGLAVTVPRRGAEVARMTEKDMEDVLQIRAALDELAVQLATEQITDEQFEEALQYARHKQVYIYQREPRAVVMQHWYLVKLTEEYVRSLAFSKFTMDLCRTLRDMEKEHPITDRSAPTDIHIVAVPVL